jgi:transposase
MTWTVAIGIDTHKDEHVAVAFDRLGRQLDTRSEPASARGYLALLRWAQALGEPAFAIEGSGSYGSGLTRVLLASGAEVYECERPRRRERGRSKSDLLDAALAARRLLSGDGLSRPRGGGPREDLRLLLAERRGTVRAQTATSNQLQAVLVVAPERLRGRLGELRGQHLIAACARLRPGPVAERVPSGVLRRLGRRAQALAEELAALDRELEQLVAELVPELLAECGVGAVCAAQLVVSSGDPQRMRKEASFAALAGTSPVEASSGKQQRHRLNRGGDRQLNRALHVIALNRVRYHRETAAYYRRLLDSGKSAREARRCVKRALARYFYRRLCELPQLRQGALHA